MRRFISNKWQERWAPLKGGYGNEGYAIVELEDSILTFGGYWKNGTCSEYVFQFKVKVASKIYSLRRLKPQSKIKIGDEVGGV